MLTPVCLAVLTAIGLLKLTARLRHRWRVRASLKTTRLGASLPPTWRPPSPRPVTVLDAGRPLPREDWSRYERPAYQRRAHPLPTATRTVRAVRDEGENPC